MATQHRLFVVRLRFPIELSARSYDRSGSTSVSVLLSPLLLGISLQPLIRFDLRRACVIATGCRGVPGSSDGKMGILGVSRLQESIQENGFGRRHLG